MGLFSILLLNTTAASNANSDVDEISTTASTNATNTNPANIPTVVQLYTSRPVSIIAIDTAAVATDVLENEKSQGKTAFKKYHTHSWLMSEQTLDKSSSSSFAPLRYSAVQCLPESALEKLAQLSSSTSTATAGGGLRNQSRLIQEMAHQWIPPDLGLWYCRCDGGKMTDALLPRTLTAASKPPVYCMVVDMTEPNLVHVESNISTMQQTLLRFLIQHAAEFRSQTASAVTTTSLAQLRTVQFGLANQDAKHKTAADTQSSGVLESESEVRLALQICVLWPQSASSDPSETGAEETNASSMDYKTQQHLQLLMYHIRKYAAVLNASLLFLDANDEDASILDQSSRPTSSTAQQPTVSRRELPFLWKDLASGIAIWRSTSQEETPSEADDETTSGFSLIYGPDHHQEDLIESVLLRSASYPSHWDAAKDSIWNILQPPRPRPPATPSLPSGDAAWCKELYDSMAGQQQQQQQATTGLQSPAPSSKGSVPSSAAKTPNDAAVSSFFEGLLK